VKLVEQTLQARFLKQRPRRLIADKAYDSAKLEAELREQGIELVCPVRSKAGRPYTTRRQDGRPLRRYRKRWKVERLFSWLLRCRRLVNRWEPKAENFLGFVQLGCIRILLRHL
jgi:transposase